jgi:hypothetical protein
VFSAPKGNLVKNPGFELGLAFWNVPRVLMNCLYMNAAIVGGSVHTGLAMLAMGCFDPTIPTVVYQDVQICPGKNYELNFAVSGEIAAPNCLSADVRWLDEDDDDMGVALCIQVPRNSIASIHKPSWTMHTGITNTAPLGARKVRISFTTGEGSAVLFLDDVVFYELE